jgi:hypothetical protein
VLNGFKLKKFKLTTTIEVSLFAHSTGVFNFFNKILNKNEQTRNKMVFNQCGGRNHDNQRGESENP